MGEGVVLMPLSLEGNYCSKHRVKHRKKNPYASCIKSKTIVSGKSALSLSNHSIGCDLEAYAEVLRFRNCNKEADELDGIAARIK